MFCAILSRDIQGDTQGEKNCKFALKTPQNAEWKKCFENGETCQSILQEDR